MRRHSTPYSAIRAPWSTTKAGLHKRPPPPPYGPLEGHESGRLPARDQSSHVGHTEPTRRPVKAPQTDAEPLQGPYFWPETHTLPEVSPSVPVLRNWLHGGT